MNLYGHKVNQLGRCFNKKLNEKITPLGLHASQWGMILYLNEKKDCTQVEISQYLNVEAPTVTRTLARLEDMGLVERNISANDKREKRISLTGRAKEIFSQCMEASDELEKEALEGISPDELELFNAVLEKMMRNLE